MWLYVWVCESGSVCECEGWSLLDQEPPSGTSLLRTVSSDLNLGCFKCIPGEIPSPPLTSFRLSPNPLQRKILNPFQLFCAKGVECWCAEIRTISSLHEGKDSALHWLNQSSKCLEVNPITQHQSWKELESPSQPILQMRGRGKGKPIIAWGPPLHLPSSWILWQQSFKTRGQARLQELSYWPMKVTSKTERGQIWSQVSIVTRKEMLLFTNRVEKIKEHTVSIQPRKGSRGVQASMLSWDGRVQTMAYTLPCAWWWHAVRTAGKTTNNLFISEYHNEIIFDCY